MSSSLSACTWSADRMSEALTALARASRLPLRAVNLPPSSDVERAAAWVGLEAEPVEATYPNVEALLCGMGPALVRLEDGAFLAVVVGRARRVSVMAPDLSVRELGLAELRSEMVRDLEAPLRAEVDRILDAAGVRASKRARARQAILESRLVAARVGRCWLLRATPGARFVGQTKRAGIPWRLTVLLLAHSTRYALLVFGWWMVGRGALEGRLDRGWLLAWSLVLFTQIPFALLTTWSQGIIAIDAGALLKQRLLAGALLLAPEEIRKTGAGQLLGRVLESGAVESLALSAGFTGLVASLELLLAFGVLWFGAGGIVHAILLAAWTTITVLFGWRYFRHRAQWTEARLDMTNDLVERMVGHRTRLAQQSPERWHEGEDEAIDRYLLLSRRMDAYGSKLSALLPRGWIVVGLAGMAPAFVLGVSSPTSLAVALGGTLLAYRALRKLVAGLASLAGAAIAWQKVASLFHAAARMEPPAVPDLAQSGPATDPARPILEANELVFRYRDRGEPVLRGCSLRVHPGDRILLEGGSGGGKSTLGSLLSGLRAPESGLLLLGGLDRKTLGSAGWRRRIVSAPQFHENHVLSATFAFNLLMGRAWPPDGDDFALATAVCEELDLGPLLARMPAGLLQMVGETGWQLSHGEKSRLYIARALLQRANLIVLDESFAALDPETLRRSLECVRSRANALLVIAHP